MSAANPPLDAKAVTLLKQVQKSLDELLAANTGTALGVAHPRLVAAVDELAKYRYRQIGAMEPQPAKR